MSISSRDLGPLNAPFFPTVFIRNQFRSAPQWLPPTTNLSGQTVIVTGSNTGLGLESARQLLSFRLSHLVMAVRSMEKGNAAAEGLKAQYPKADIEVWELDMSSYTSVQSFTERVEKDLHRVDIVILNSGLALTKFSTVPSTGHEQCIQVNYLSTMLLCVLLLPILKHKAPSGHPGRITIVNSAVALTSKIANRDAVPVLPWFDDPKNFDQQEQYQISKTLAHFFIPKLADLVPANDVVINLVDPGWIRGTQLVRDAGRALRALLWLFMALAAKSVVVGASTYLDAAIRKGRESHGSFLMSWKIQPFHSYYYTPEGQRYGDRVWEETLDELQFANVRDIIDSVKQG